jgi:hypothetical protein
MKSNLLYNADVPLTCCFMQWGPVKHHKYTIQLFQYIVLWGFHINLHVIIEYMIHLHEIQQHKHQPYIAK